MSAVTSREPLWGSTFIVMLLKNMTQMSAEAKFKWPIFQTVSFHWGPSSDNEVAEPVQLGHVKDSKTHKAVLTTVVPRIMTVPVNKDFA